MENSQLDRAKRYLDRIERLSFGIPQVFPNIEYYTDDVISFFVHCYHVRDWLLELNSAVMNKKEIDDYINDNWQLSVCADFANSSKHCRLTRSLRTKSEPFITKVMAQYEPEEREARNIISASFTLETDAGRRDVMQTARECISLWEAFLKLKNIT